jgi:hypothetical protein
MHQQSLDYYKHCSIAFGSYVQAHTYLNPQNTQHPRTLDSIYLRYIDNGQGCFQVLDLGTGGMIQLCRLLTWFVQWHSMIRCQKD